MKRTIGVLSCLALAATAAAPLVAQLGKPVSEVVELELQGADPIFGGPGGVGPGRAGAVLVAVAVVMAVARAAAVGMAVGVAVVMPAIVVLAVVVAGIAPALALRRRRRAPGA